VVGAQKYGLVARSARDVTTIVTHGSVEIEWYAEPRIAVVRYGPDTNLQAPDGRFLVDALTGWIGAEGEPFAVLAHAAGVRGTDAAYRATASAFFRRHRDAACIALVNMGPVLSLVVDMFRVGTGIQLKGFADEAVARSWLRTKGVRA
jgi:hypothetical protein